MAQHFLSLLAYGVLALVFWLFTPPWVSWLFLYSGLASLLAGGMGVAWLVASWLFSSKN